MEEQTEEQKGKERATFTRTPSTWTDMKMHLLRSSRSEISLPRVLCTLPLGLSMHDLGDNTSPELHSLFILIYPTNHLFIHMIHDDLCRVNNATTNAAISMAMEVLLCPLFVSGVVVERRAQSDSVSYTCGCKLPLKRLQDTVKLPLNYR